MLDVNPSAARQRAADGRYPLEHVLLRSSAPCRDSRTRLVIHT